MGPKNRGPRPQPDDAAELLSNLRSAFAWRGDRTDPTFAADPTGWWADSSILRRLGPALAAPFDDLTPTVVLGPQSSGALLSALVAIELGVGLVELRKNPLPATDSDQWLTRTDPARLAGSQSAARSPARPAAVECTGGVRGRLDRHRRASGGRPSTR